MMDTADFVLKEHAICSLYYRAAGYWRQGKAGEPAKEFGRMKSLTVFHVPL